MPELCTHLHEQIGRLLHPACFREGEGRGIVIRGQNGGHVSKGSWTKWLPGCILWTRWRSCCKKNTGKMVTTVWKIEHEQNGDHGAFVDKIAVMMHKRTRKKWCLWYEKKNMDKLATMVLKDHGNNGDHDEFWGQIAAMSQKRTWTKWRPRGILWTRWRSCCKKNTEKMAPMVRKIGHGQNADHGAKRHGKNGSHGCNKSWQHAGHGAKGNWTKWCKLSKKDKMVTMAQKGQKQWQYGGHIQKAREIDGGHT